MRGHRLAWYHPTTAPNELVIDGVGPHHFGIFGDFSTIEAEMRLEGLAPAPIE
jgi:hypothetical protein